MGRDDLVGEKHEKPISESIAGLEAPPEKKPRLEEADDDIDSPQAPMIGESSGEPKQSPPQSEEEESEESEEEGIFDSPPRPAKDISQLHKLGLQKPRSYEEFVSNGLALSQANIYPPDTMIRPYGIGEPADKDLVEEYLRQIDESDGFDVTVYPGPCPMATFIPLDSFLEEAELHKDLIDMAKMALDAFNNKHKKGTPYEFDRIERATTFPCQGDIYHITFQARQADADVLHTFQAKVYEFLKDREVELVRRKRI